jgi:hypothetical protein
MRQPGISIYVQQNHGMPVSIRTAPYDALHCQTAVKLLEGTASCNVSRYLQGESSGMLPSIEKKV